MGLADVKTAWDLKMVGDELRLRCEWVSDQWRILTLRGSLSYNPCSKHTYSDSTGDSHEDGSHKRAL
ncbi:hypothetical protein ACRRTK_009333 [Alexandromys fortis]